MKSSMNTSDCSEKCRFSSDCKLIETVSKTKSCIKKKTITYFLSKCLPGSKNEYGIESAPLYSITLSHPETGEESRLCCLTTSSEEAMKLFDLITQNAVMPFEASEVLSEYICTIKN